MEGDLEGDVGAMGPELGAGLGHIMASDSHSLSCTWYTILGQVSRVIPSTLPLAERLSSCDEALGLSLPHEFIALLQCVWQALQQVSEHFCTVCRCIRLCLILHAAASTTYAL